MPGPLLTCDVWDTVLRRRCHPDEVKVRSARWLLGQLSGKGRRSLPDAWEVFALRNASELRIGEQHRALGGDFEYRFADVAAAVVAHLLPGLPTAQVDAMAGSWSEAEIAIELDSVYLDPGIVRRIARIPHARLGFISDFYFGEAMIRRLLRKVGWGEAFEFVLVSCDAGVNKRSGRLFSELHRRLGIAPNAHRHIGDHLMSDVRVPRGLGMRTYLYRPRHHRQRVAAERRFAARTARQWLDLQQVFASERGTGLHGRLETQVAVIASAVVIAAADMATRIGCRTVFFFTREGRFLLQVFEALQSAGLIPAQMSGRLLEVSRMATFGPSLKQVSIRELMRIWGTHKDQSIQVLLQTFGVETAPFEAAIRQHGIEPLAKIANLWQDPRVVALLDDPAFIEPLRSTLALRRQGLLGRLAQCGFPTSGDAVVVDLGWKGTIQDNLCHLLPGCRIHGFYTALLPYFNEQPPNAFKTASGINLNSPLATIPQHAALAHIVPLEMVFNGPGGSVTGYEQTAPFQPLVQVDAMEERTWTSSIAPLQAAVLERIRSAAPDLVRWGVSAVDLKAAASQAMTDLLTRPSRELAKSYLDLHHNDVFGTGQFIRGRATIPWTYFCSALFHNSARRRLWMALAETTWPQGYLVRAGLGCLVGLFNRKLIKIEALSRGRFILPPPRPDYAMEEQLNVIDQLRAELQDTAGATGREDLHGDGPTGP